jgi:hypothetical protein
MLERFQKQRSFLDPLPPESGMKFRVLLEMQSEYRGKILKRKRLAADSSAH